VTTRDLDLLTAACDPATFGRGNEDVYDESYRKAVKMDASNFSVQLDLGSSGLMGTIEDQLLRGESQKMYIRPEPYKLNVYGNYRSWCLPSCLVLYRCIREGKDSFFKAHKDTPRGTDMLGSLVVVYPTPHEGGELVLRHKGHEWKFDANGLTSSRPSPSLVYIAFYSDIEHEVLKVTSGHRATVTYNLYLVDPASRPGASTVAPDLKDASNLQVALRKLLESPEFLPDGGTLGFGLVHLYPVTFGMKLQKMISYLKGEDADIYRACRELGLQPSLQMIYSDEESGPKYGIMLNEIIHEPCYDFQNAGETYGDALVRELGGVPVNKVEGAELNRSYWVSEDGGEETGEFISWVSPFNERNRLQDVTLAYGNDFSVGYIYCSPCMIVRVAAAIDRM